jgi:hypothetical protein
MSAATGSTGDDSRLRRRGPGAAGRGFRDGSGAKGVPAWRIFATWWVLSGFMVVGGVKVKSERV